MRRREKRVIALILSFLLFVCGVFFGVSIEASGSVNATDIVTEQRVRNITIKAPQKYKQFKNANVTVYKK